MPNWQKRNIRKCTRVLRAEQGGQNANLVVLTTFRTVLHSIAKLQQTPPCDHRKYPGIIKKMIYFEHPHPKALLAQEIGYFPVPPPTSTVFLAAPQMHCKNIAVWHCRVKCCKIRHCKGWAQQGHFAMGTAGIRCHGHCRETVGLGTAGILCCWALQEYSAVAAGHHCQRYCAVIGHCRGTLRLHTARILDARFLFKVWATGQWKHGECVIVFRFSECLLLLSFLVSVLSFSNQKLCVTNPMSMLCISYDR